MSAFPGLVAAALDAARQKHGAQRSRHEGYAVILEELDEVKEVVWHDGSDADLLKELVQTAAMCQRMAEDLMLMLGLDGRGPQPVLRGTPRPGHVSGCRTEIGQPCSCGAGSGGHGPL